MISTKDIMNITDLPFQRKSTKETIHNLRRKYAWYVLAAGGCLVLLAITLLIYRYFSTKKTKTQNYYNDYRNRPLPSLPSSERTTGGIVQDDLSTGYLSPNFTGIEIPPLLPKRDFAHYVNNDNIQTMMQHTTLVSSININGNLQQLNILQGAATVNIGGKNYEKD